MFCISSLLRRSRREYCGCLIKQISRDSRIKIVAELDSKFLEGFENETMSYSQHAGKVSRDLAKFDDEMINTINIILKDVNKKKLLIDAKLMCNYLRERQPPISRAEYREQKLKCSQKVMEKMKIDPSKLPEEKFVKTEKLFSDKVNRMLKSNIYNWQPVDYTNYVGKQYLVNRMIAEYAALKRIFFEIASRNPDFQPATLFDFGSGVGTVTWAVRKQWPNSLNECYNVDTSGEMNDIAELLLKGGDPDASFPIRSVFYRQFLNADTERKYNLVVSSYTLMELPSQEIRLKTLTNLWNKTQDFLVLVENGTSAGFNLIHEARDFLLETGTLNENASDIHIFSPCPHKVSCPQKRYTDRPCCFKASYMLPPIGRKQIICNELYSFIVFRKQRKLENEEEWPRVLKKATKKKKIARCRLCCPDGKLRIVTFTKSKHGRDVVLLLRCSHSCDRFPAKLREVNIDFNDLSSADVVEISSSEDLRNEFDDDDSSDESDA